MRRVDQETDDYAIISTEQRGFASLVTPHNSDVSLTLIILKEDVMLKQFFKDHLRIQALREGPDGPLLEGFAEELYQAGYAKITARRHIRAAEHLVYWTERKAHRSRI